jgi:hypothetical protein|tara:strand:- start:3 stop:524 length:522 start_codon:yes stop_codon:yes gene_type:complete
MNIFNLLLVILILFILFNNHFNKEIYEIEDIKNNTNNTNNNNYNHNKIKESFQNNDMKLEIENQMNNIGSEFKNTIIRNYQVQPNRIVKSTGNLHIKGNKKYITGTVIIKSPTDFEVFNDDLKNKDLQRKIKSDVDKNKFNFRMKIDGKIINTKVKHLFKGKNLYLKFNLIIV